MTGWTVLPVLQNFWSQVTFPVGTLLVDSDSGGSRRSCTLTKINEDGVVLFWPSLIKDHIVALDVVVQETF